MVKVYDNKWVISEDHKKLVGIVRKITEGKGIRIEGTGDMSLSLVNKRFSKKLKQLLKAKKRDEFARGYLNMEILSTYRSKMMLSPKDNNLAIFLKWNQYKDLAVEMGEAYEKEFGGEAKIIYDSSKRAFRY